MTALLRYQADLLVRSQRWLPPVILYAAFLGIGVQSGQPVLSSLGYTAAGLLPVAAWLVRICVTGEPDAARACVAAARGPARAHLACLLTALLAAVALGVLATVVVTLISAPASDDHHIHVPALKAAAAGLPATLACALLGAAVGALTNRPVLCSTGRAVPAMLLGALLAVVLTGSPAQAAVSGLVTGSQTGRVAVPLLPPAGAALLTAAAFATAAGLSARRSP
ncbi:ABC transporter [Streptomyces broussonetiae]|uniref:ABC transporter n=1 Tax=Streptomyces broussonetiae TaxID=2686304 RepID=A0A6I6NGT0_9ACTN|nr:ABC transporter [Streptomyces broussonetiae]QHA07436.1 ABC transporter [Streptomyces broussonetiae]